MVFTPSRGELSRLSLESAVYSALAKGKLRSATERQIEREAGLLALEAVFHLVAGEVAARIGRLRIEWLPRPGEVEGLAGKAVAAGAGGDVDDAVPGAAELGGEGAGEHGHVLHEAGRHREFLAAEEVFVVVEAVDQVAGEERIGAVDADVRRLRKKPVAWVTFGRR